MKQSHCDICGIKIEESKCDCGIWYEKNKYPLLLNTIINTIQTYNFHYDQGEVGPVCSADHHSGSCIILFKGDYAKCLLAKQYVENLVLKGG